jgi:ATP-dependent helicase/nuclease subunit B
LQCAVAQWHLSALHGLILLQVRTIMKASIIKWLQQVCQTSLLTEKWLVAPGHRIGNQWKDRICFAGTRTVNLHTKTVPSVVLHLVAGKFLSEQMQYAPPAACAMLIHGILQELKSEGKLGYFARVQSVDRFVEIVTASLADYRLAGLSSDDWQPDAFEESAKSHDILLILQRFEQLLTDLKLADYASCLRLAKQILRDQPTRLAGIQLLMPFELDLCKLESDLIEQLKSVAEVIFPEKTEPPHSESKPQLRFQRAQGEVNEVRTMIQQIISQAEEQADWRFDQIEVLHTDYQTYVPLIHELFASLAQSDTAIDDLPVTFAEGIACIYARPGRALRGWLRWLDSDCLQSQLVQLIREGLLRFDGDASYTRLAHALRKISIGLGRNRYLVKLDEAIEIARQSIAVISQNPDISEQDDRPRDFGLGVIQQLRATLGGLIENSPSREDPATDILRAAKKFLLRFGRAESKLDRYARQRLLDDIDGMHKAIELSPSMGIDVWSWLENLPIESRVLASGPLPQRLHVDHVARGGHSGRQKTFILGLDDSRFPQRGGQDPLLLDWERQKLSADLPIAAESNSKSVARFFALIERLSGEVVCSYAVTSMSNDREQYLSSTLLDLYRQHTGKNSATLQDFELHTGQPNTFCQSDDQRFLSADDWWMATLLNEPDQELRHELLEKGFDHHAAQQRAAEHRDLPSFSEFDGQVPAAAALAPTDTGARAISSTRLETFGTCPRKYFFRYGLGIYPPDELIVDQQTWLDALVYGRLLHTLFEEFLQPFAAKQKTPKLVRDLPKLLKLLEQTLADYRRDFPIPNQDAYERQRKQLEKTCAIFLREEEKFCQANGAIPWILEASIGLGDEPVSQVDLSEPVELKLGDGRSLRVSGRIDRIDCDPKDGNLFSIWDYKSGSDYGYNQADPFQQGRKLQPFLYVGMLRHRLRKVVGKQAAVGYFGYFFPSPRMNGKRIQWTGQQLASGDQILTQICDLLSSGVFLATNHANDCNYCEYQEICGDPNEIAENSQMKLDHPRNRSLDPFRQLRQTSNQGGAQ